MLALFAALHGVTGSSQCGQGGGSGTSGRVVQILQSAGNLTKVKHELAHSSGYELQVDTGGGSAV